VKAGERKERWKEKLRVKGKESKKQLRRARGE
jgi:hypothetical protein